MIKAEKSKLARRVIDWERVQAEYTVGGLGNSVRQIAERHGISHTAIQKRIAKENWASPGDFDEQIRKKVATKVAGVVATGNPLKVAECIEVEADRRAAVVRQHQAEWEEIEQLRREALETRHARFLEDGALDESTGTAAAFERAKLLKIMTEATATKQAGQRKAFSLDAKADHGSGDVPASLAKILEQIGESAGAGDGTTGIGAD